MAGDCPANIVVQSDWFPESEHGAFYELLGPDYKVDTDKKIVRGSLITPEGASTGVTLEIRTGGPATGYQGPSATMAADSSITFGFDSEGNALLYGKTPMLQVMAPLEKSPQMLMWDPATYPNVKTIKDLGAAGVTINVFSKDLMAEAIADGTVKDAQVDPSYDGTAARFIASGGKIAQQGFASAEPYIYLHDPKWAKPVAYQLFYDAGYQSYAETLAIRAGDLDKLRPCLKKFVPLMQRAVVAFAKSPDRANAIIVDAVAKYKDTWVYDAGLAAFSVAEQIKSGVLSNGPDKIVGNFDMTRADKVLAQYRTAGLTGIPADLTAEKMFTNEFIDPSIGL